MFCSAYIRYFAKRWFFLYFLNFFQLFCDWYGISFHASFLKRFLESIYHLSHFVHKKSQIWLYTSIPILAKWFLSISPWEQENLWFSDVFRGHRQEELVLNKLKGLGENKAHLHDLEAFSTLLVAIFLFCKIWQTYNHGYH